ncbi:hypothetical protein AVEN_5056-1 [Araneus ventricosus]|uniref:Uncharacterized protein n=1 Tax=Araneus ventricosus TaxID=182803 RepID=A0A4Y2TXG9_ARAVE|nr:hypothetical protein AVEN_5056-1 [Araneus ventricosus]
MYLSVRVTAFTARLTQWFLQKYGIAHSITPPFLPRALWTVPMASLYQFLKIRKNGTLNYLTPYWKLAPRNKIQQGKSPFFLLHEYEPRLPRELHIASFIDDTPREDQLDLLMLVRAVAANNVYETHVDNKRKFDLHRQPHSFKPGDLVLYDWQKQCDHKLSPMFR